MGFFQGGFVVIGVLLVSVFFAPGLPPHYEFESYSLAPPPKLEGPLAPNSILDRAASVQLDSPIFGPESIAIRGNEVFTGLQDGSLVKIKNGKVTRILSLGSSDCGAVSCGRIAGVRFDSNSKLLVADAVNGIHRVDVDSGKRRIEETIFVAVDFRVTWSDNVIGKAVKLVSLDVPIDNHLPGFPNDLDVDKNGDIYWSDSSTIARIDNMMLEPLAGPSGRLVKYSAKTGKNVVLIPKLHFANGVQLSADGEFVLVSDLMRARVMRHYIKGKNEGQTDVFVDNLPGMPDNIRSNGKGGFYIMLAAPRLESEFSLVNYIGEWPLTRRFIVRLNYFLVKALTEIRNQFPNVVLNDWVAYVKRFGPVGDLENGPFKTIVVETDKTGKIIGSLQNDKGPITQLSEISVGKEWTYFGSPAGRQLYRIKTSDLSK